MTGKGSRISLSGSGRGPCEGAHEQPEEEGRAVSVCASELGTVIN